MFQSRAFRVLMSALGLLVVVLSLLLIVLIQLHEARAEERNATPTEIQHAALDGQIEAMRRAGYSEECLFEVKIFGSLCIGQCSDGGFALHLNDDYPQCSIDYCVCEDDTSPRHDTE